MSQRPLYFGGTGVPLRAWWPASLTPKGEDPNAEPPLLSDVELHAQKTNLATHVSILIHQLVPGGDTTALINFCLAKERPLTPEIRQMIPRIKAVQDQYLITCQHLAQSSIAVQSRMNLVRARQGLEMVKLTYCDVVSTDVFCLPIFEIRGVGVNCNDFELLRMEEVHTHIAVEVLELRHSVLTLIRERDTLMEIARQYEQIRREVFRLAALNEEILRRHGCRFQIFNDGENGEGLLDLEEL